jgi:uncharacterized membrane protein YqiK
MMDLGNGFVTLLGLSWGAIGIAGGIGFLVLLLALILFIRLFYKKCEMDEALVRSGSGGARVALQGGMWVFGIVHNFQRVTLRTLKLDVKTGKIRSQAEGIGKSELDQAADSKETGGIVRGMGVMRTSDSLPIILDAEVYVRVPRREEYIIAAATTMGEKIDPTPFKPKKRGGRVSDGDLGFGEDQAAKAILELVEQKLRSAVRGAAASMTLSQMHTDRIAFTESVSEQLRQDLKENGLELETFAIESLDQEPLSVVSETADENVFDANAVRTLTVAIEQSQTGINQAKRDNEIARNEQNTQFEVRRLAFEQQEVFAKAEQNREVANKKVSESARISTWEAETEKEKTLAVEEADLVSSKKLEEVARDLQVFQAECEKETEVAKAVNEKTFELERLSTFRTVETAEEESKKSVQLAAIERVEGVGVLANRSKEAVGVAQNEAEGNIAVAGVALEGHMTYLHEAETITATAKAKIESAKDEENLRRTVIIPAERAAEKIVIDENAAAEKVVIAENAAAEKVVIEEKAAAETVVIAEKANAEKLRLVGLGDRDKRVLVAEADVAESRGKRDANLARGEGAEALLALGRAEAESLRLEGEADKVKAEAALLNDDTVWTYLLAKNLPELARVLPPAIEAAFKPLENIDGFRILQVNTDGGGGSGGSPMGSAMKTILNNAPAGALLNEFLQMSGVKKNWPELLEKFVTEGARVLEKTAAGSNVVDLEGDNDDLVSTT